MKVIINNNIDVPGFIEVAYKMRHYQRLWKQNYGAVNRNKMKLWEDKMDKLLTENIDNFNTVLTSK